MNIALILTGGSGVLIHRDIPTWTERRGVQHLQQGFCTVRQFVQAVADAADVEILFEEPAAQEKGS